MSEQAPDMPPQDDPNPSQVILNKDGKIIVYGGAAAEQLRESDKKKIQRDMERGQFELGERMARKQVELDERTARKQFELGEQMARAQIASEEEAARVAARLKKPRVHLKVVRPEPESKFKKAGLKGLEIGADATMTGIGKLANAFSNKWDGFWADIEKRGDAILKPFQTKMKIAPWALVFLTPFVGLGASLAGFGVFFGNKALLKPTEKPLEEQKAEWAKKWEAEKKKREAEAKKKESEKARQRKLVESGLTNVQAEVLLAAVKEEEKAEEQKKNGAEKETMPAEPKEKKAA